MGSCCTFGAMEHSGTFRNIFGHGGTKDRRDLARELGSFCAIVTSVAPGRTGLHQVAGVCLSSCQRTPACGFAEHRVPGIDARWSAKPQAARRAENSAPSTTPQSCAIWTTIAHDRAPLPRKARQIIPDSHNSFCAL